MSFLAINLGLMRTNAFSAALPRSSAFYCCCILLVTCTNHNSIKMISEFRGRGRGNCIMGLMPPLSLHTCRLHMAGYLEEF